jgi:hypothetical protein
MTRLAWAGVCATRMSMSTTSRSAEHTGREANVSEVQIDQGAICGVYIPNGMSPILLGGGSTGVATKLTRMFLPAATSSSVKQQLIS